MEDQPAPPGRMQYPGTRLQQVDQELDDGFKLSADCKRTLEIVTVALLLMALAVYVSLQSSTEEL